MPSLALSDKKEEKKMKKKKIALETPELVLKKGKKLKLSDSDDEESEKKHKAAEIGETSEEEVKSDSSSEKKKSSKKVKLGVDNVEVDSPNAVSKFRISAPFDMVLDGDDLVGRARTGQGKTLAFVLPILESLINGPAKSKRKNGYGRPPSVLVLLPTRELAKQVAADFEAYGGSLGLTSCCLYGGDPYAPQENKLRRGVDIVVGTPGRIKDHLERQNIDLSFLQFRVLDEADEMLRMGFVEDVELILGKVEDANKVQTFLFSATLPSWVKNISTRFLKPNKKTIDLVGNDINDVQLIIECEPPREVEAYIHRSDRTGRVGNTGVAVNRSSYTSASRSHCTWLILSLLSLQLILFLTLRSLPFPRRHIPENFLSPVAVTVSASASASASTAPLITRIQPEEDNSGRCDSGRVFVYEMPKMFNEVILQQCDNLNPWSSRCDALSNDGFGKEATSLKGVIPDDLVPSWFWTDQFVSEVIFHNRILNHRCRTLDPESATAFYIPFYAGLAVGQYLWSNYEAADRDRHCKMMTQWVRDQPYWNKSNGWDHFITMGRITWDFRRSKDEDWGSNCIYIPGMRNITRLLIERNSWDHFDVGVPYPTGFHPRTDSDVVNWQDFVRNHRRETLFCFAGAPRAGIVNDFRGLLLRHCEESRGVCRTVDCTVGKCSNGSSAILETFLGSDFCLQPRGDSFTRRSIFDCMLAGSIPVFFWRRTAYMQYQWFLPDKPESYSVFIDRNEVKNGTTSIREVLERYSKEDVRKMRERVIDLIPNLVYSKSPNGLETFKDAFDVAIDGVFKRFKEQQNWYKW